ncbi:hypothetical protein QYM36_017135 [Artemia franciscana]|uniref:RNA-directed DNA polymerase n=1 Tax=Artemia franciscana TaxID=6661 RepID=A0AA88KSM7_ARTSF|nr:hypothetical protein QYM36_017135 [Artemia franciscana]
MHQYCAMYLVFLQDEYQQKIDKVFTELDIRLIVDDIAGIGYNDAEHDAKLRAVLQAARDKGVRFNKEKCVFDTTSITYFGHRLTTSSITPDPEKTKVLENMPTPQKQEELQTLLGMYNYLSRYIPNLATLNKPLRDLSKQQKFKWNTSHKEAKRGIQNAISKNLSYFDPDAKEIEVITDASQHGLGAQLSMDRATIAFASCSLSETEQRYSQMEKEMLAITFACKRFHLYLFGRTICMTTDHKPLELTFGKSIQRAPPRLQQMTLAIQLYDIKLRYKPGKTIPVADTLSHLHLADTDIELQVDMEILVHSVLQTIPIASQRLAQICRETTKDETLNSLLETIQVGWPNNKKSLDRKLGPFWNYCYELAVLDGLVVKGECIVIPRCMRAGILGQLHSSHLGVVKTKGKRARTSVFSPGITRDIERLFNQCKVCAKFAMNQHKEPMILHKIPDYPFQHVAADLFQINRQD